ncbi:BRO [Orgyia pseudotsugata single capsid nuclopolyhedrovirus]|nr:BRO [Orgyia pseudotsugata single capsid nuclopolyhedrovirus]
MLANPFARVLEYVNSRNAVAKFVGENNQKQYQEIKAPRFEALASSLHPQSKFINRAGLFELIQASRMPKAQEFKNWINSDLLPKLCDNGKYDMVIDAPADIAYGMNAVHQYAFLRPQRRNMKRSLDRLSVDSREIVFQSDYVPNAMNVLNKVKENLPKEKYTARHNKITLLEDLTRDDLVEAINSSLTQRQVAIIAKNAGKRMPCAISLGASCVMLYSPF